MTRLRNVALVVGLAAALCGCGSAVPDSQLTAAHTARHFRFFSPRSFWNTPASGREAVDPDSGQMVAGLVAEVAREVEARSGPWINTTSYSVPVVRAGASTPAVRVRLVSPYAAPALRRAFRSVPLPEQVTPSPGNDAHLVVWQPHSDRLWEFWHLRRHGDSWEAGWGGAIMNVRSAWGAYGPAAWPGATRLWGASASSLSIAGGLVTLQDLDRGWINHALTMSLPVVRAGVYSLPARRTDGTSADPYSLPEGAHLRLRPGLDLASLHLPRMTLMLARAAQRFGIFVRDRAGNVAFNAQPPRSPDRNPYLGPNGYYGGENPRQLLASFPWSDLQVLQMKLKPFKLGKVPAG
ncbi:MAG TPA: hypothetical protein VFN85_05495 [Solirubrobacterales bacterium]|nr:hypothetical protein [Solirubrobacterales bacterium]